MFSQGANSVGAAEIGLAASFLGAPGALVFGGAISAVLTLGCWIMLPGYENLASRRSTVKLPRITSKLPGYCCLGENCEQHIGRRADHLYSPSIKPLLSSFSRMLLSTTSSYLMPAAFGTDFTTSAMTLANPSRVG